MEELYDKIEKLKKALDKTQTIIELKKVLNKIKQNKELISLVEKYNITHSERVKEEILKYAEFREYKHQETELNFLILEINRELKKITKKDKCGL